jgi:hypothetical protein
MTFVLLMASALSGQAAPAPPQNSPAVLAVNQIAKNDPVKSAQSVHNRVFGIYVFLLIGTVLFTYFVWATGNRVQDTIQGQAAARIEEADRIAAEANALAQAANASAQTAIAEQEKLRNDSLRITERLQTAEKENAQAHAQIAVLEKDRTPRTISPSQQEKIASLLKVFAGQSVTVFRLASEKEAIDYFEIVCETLRKAGLNVAPTIVFSGSGTGSGIAVHDVEFRSLLASTIQNAFRAEGIPMDGIVAPNMVKQGEFVVFVGTKPKSEDVNH